MPVSHGTVIDRVPPEGRHKLQTPLSDAQSGALRTMLTAGLLRPVLDQEIAASLIAAGYVHETFGGQSLTATGEIRAMMENGQ